MDSDLSLAHLFGLKSPHRRKPEAVYERTSTLEYYENLLGKNVVVARSKEIFLQPAFRKPTLSKYKKTSLDYSKYQILSPFDVWTQTVAKNQKINNKQNKRSKHSIFDDLKNLESVGSFKRKRNADSPAIKNRKNRRNNAKYQTKDSTEFQFENIPINVENVTHDRKDIDENRMTIAKIIEQKENSGKSNEDENDEKINPNEDRKNSGKIIYAEESRQTEPNSYEIKSSTSANNENKNSQTENAKNEDEIPFYKRIWDIIDRIRSEQTEIPPSSNLETRTYSRLASEVSSSVQKKGKKGNPVQTSGKLNKMTSIVSERENDWITPKILTNIEDSTVNPNSNNNDNTDRNEHKKENNKTYSDDYGSAEIITKNSRAEGFVGNRFKRSISQVDNGTVSNSTEEIPKTLYRHPQLSFEEARAAPQRRIDDLSIIEKEATTEGAPLYQRIWDVINDTQKRTFRVIVPPIEPTKGIDTLTTTDENKNTSTSEIEDLNSPPPLSRYIVGLKESEIPNTKTESNNKIQTQASKISEENPSSEINAEESEESEEENKYMNFELKKQDNESSRGASKNSEEIKSSELPNSTENKSEKEDTDPFVNKEEIKTENDQISTTEYPKGIPPYDPKKIPYVEVPDYSDRREESLDKISEEKKIDVDTVDPEDYPLRDEASKPDDVSSHEKNDEKSSSISDTSEVEIDKSESLGENESPSTTKQEEERSNERDEERNPRRHEETRRENDETDDEPYRFDINEYKKPFDLDDFIKNDPIFKNIRDAQARERKRYENREESEIYRNPDRQTYNDDEQSSFGHLNKFNSHYPEVKRGNPFAVKPVVENHDPFDRYGQDVGSRSTKSRGKISSTPYAYYSDKYRSPFAYYSDRADHDDNVERSSRRNDHFGGHFLDHGENKRKENWRGVKDHEVNGEDKDSGVPVFGRDRTLAKLGQRSPNEEDEFLARYFGEEITRKLRGRGTGYGTGRGTGRGTGYGTERGTGRGTERGTDDENPRRIKDPRGNEEVYETLATIMEKKDRISRLNEEVDKRIQDGKPPAKYENFWTLEYKSPRGRDSEKNQTNE